jgi:hypothetical protein
MKLIEILLEIISPRKPNEVKSSRGTISGVQGSVQPIVKKEFTKSKGNAVSVRFKPSVEDGMKGADVSFFVNGTMDDSASADGKDTDNDFEILSGVLHIGMQYIDKARLNRVTFTARAGEKDSKRVHNLPIDKSVANLKNTAQKFKQELIEFQPNPEEVEKYKEYLKGFAQKFKLSPEQMAEKKYIYKEELIGLVNEILNNKFDKVDENELNKYISYVNIYTRVVTKWKSFNEFQQAIYGLAKVGESHQDGGTLVSRNRRESIYKRMINKYFSKDWNIDHQGTMFTMTRKNPI